jgi:hypothetical protein
MVASNSVPHCDHTSAELSSGSFRPQVRIVGLENVGSKCVALFLSGVSHQRPEIPRAELASSQVHSSCGNQPECHSFAAR